jgi:hypothetical protein
MTLSLVGAERRPTFIRTSESAYRGSHILSRCASPFASATASSNISGDTTRYLTINLDDLIVPPLAEWTPPTRQWELADQRRHPRGMRGSGVYEQ